MAGRGGLMMHRLAMTRPLTAVASSCIQESRLGSGMHKSAISRSSSFFHGELILPRTSSAIVDAGGRRGNFILGVRMMGGGPRTFPGGVSKWQWKRMQEKKERQIEKARLLRERQAFEERKRQELLASSPSLRVDKPWEKPPPRSVLTPLVAARDPKVTALADRFRRSGGEDLWTEDDGPEAANGAPGRISARFVPSGSSNTFVSSGPKFENPSIYERRTAQPNSRITRNSAGSNEVDNSFRNSTQVESGVSSSAAYRTRPGSISEDESKLQGRRGAEVGGLIRNLENLSFNRKFSSSAAAAFVDTVDSEQGVAMKGRERNSSRRGRKPARENEGGGGGPGKRSAVEVPESSGASRLVSDVQQQRKKVRPSPPRLPNEEETTPSHLSDARFQDYRISPLSLRALHEVMGYQKMTKVQEATFPVILEGKDVLAKAKTGTGKTIAFLLPSIEAILKASASSELIGGRCPIHVLIICPTRELATQAATEAKTLFTFHKRMDAQIVIGGTNVNTEANNLQKNPCQVLVATPGRLLDHMTSSREVLQQLSQLKVLVLDEADRLLDMGFKKDLERIIKMLPASRQTLLFSATVPKEVHQVSKVALKENHVFIDTVGQDDEETHAKVEQSYTVSPLENQLEVVAALLENHMEEDPDYKVLVFCTTARVTALMAEWSQNLGYNTLEIHSRKSQAVRTRVSNSFRSSSGGVIMYTSDVSARGVDYPDVTLVIQLGCPSGREDYIHRLGRTGRAGKEGQGVLILAPWEKPFLRALKDISIEEYQELEVSNNLTNKVNKALSLVSTETKEKAYQAWLGYYNSARLLGLQKPELVRLANSYSATLGLDEPPLLLKKTIGMMGLRGVPGLRTR